MGLWLGLVIRMRLFSWWSVLPLDATPVGVCVVVLALIVAADVSPERANVDELRIAEIFILSDLNVMRL